MDDNCIIEGLNQKDINALQAIYDRWFSQLLLYSRKITGDEEEAFDIATDVYLKVWQRHNTFKSIEHLRGYLYKAVRNSSISFRRALKRKHNYVGEVEALSIEENSLIERYSVEAALLEKLYGLINQLPPKQRETFTLYYVDGKTTAEVATLLQIEKKTVYAHCEQVLKKLRLVFAREGLLLFSYVLIQVLKKICS